MPGYTSYPFDSFGKGLNLQAKPDAVSPEECIDALNVLYSDRGAISQRPGYEALTAALTNRVDSLEPFYTAAGVRQLLAGCGTRLEALEAAGTVKASKTGLEGGPWDFCRFSAPTAEAAYAGNGLNTLLKWNGTEWTAPTATVNGEAAKAMPKARFITIQTPDNRMVATGFGNTAGGPGGAASSPSHVYWSEAGLPEAWKTAGTETNPANNVILSPGDGEPITGVITWRELLFIFKETKFFVFYGNSTDAKGNPVFNYRTVESGAGCISPRSIAVHRSGVYFLGRTGVFRTTGQEPVLVSNLVEPIFEGGASVFYTGGVLSGVNVLNCAMGVWGDRIYLAYPTSSVNNRMLVYDPTFEWWSLYDIPASALTSFRVTAGVEELVFGYASGENRIGRHNLTAANDVGAAINSYWRSGWFDLGSPDVKTIRSSKVWGSGTVNMSLGYDFRQGTGKSNSFNFIDLASTQWGGSSWGGGTWAEPRGLIPAARRIATRGTVFSVYFNNTILNQEWSIHRVDHHLREIRKPETVNA